MKTTLVIGFLMVIGIIAAISRTISARRRRNADDAALIRAFDQSWALSNAYDASENHEQRCRIAPDVEVARENLKQELLKIRKK